MANQKDNNAVDILSRAYSEMSKHWELIDDLLGGTLAMRAAGRRWLPQETKEENKSYENRLKRSTLYGAYKDTIDDLVGRPFSKPVTIHAYDKLGDILQAISDNCDKQGTDITQFAKELFETLLNRGLAHILVDYPNVKTEDGRPLTKADEKALNLRPYFVQIKPEQLIGWRYEIDETGEPKLSQIRWKTTRTEPDGLYGEKTVEEIRVMTTTGWEVHTKQGKKYALSDSGEHNYPDGIPLVTCYVNKDGFMTAKPPLEGLAWLNLDHWQGHSDQKNLLRFIRFPILFFKGLSKDEIEEEVIIGPGRKVSSTNPDADGKYLEHTGAAAEAGRQDLLDTEERMTVLGLEPLLSRPGNQTATGQSIDEAKSQSSIQAWIRSLELALYTAFEIAGKWLEIELPEDFKADIYNDFGVSIRATADIDALIKMRQAGELDRETFLREVKRRALLSDMAEIDVIKANLEAEGPALGLLREDDGGNE